MSYEYLPISAPELEEDPLPEEPISQRRSLFGILWQSFQDRKSSRWNRLRLIVFLASLWALLWLGLIMLRNDAQMRLVILCGAFAIMAAWWGLVLIVQQDRDSTRLFLLHWGMPPVLWGLVIIGLSFSGITSRLLLLIIGLAGIGLFFVRALLMKSWMIELRAGDVYFWLPLNWDEEQFRLLEGPDVATAWNTNQSASETVAERATKRAIEQMTQVIMPNLRKNAWIRPLDDLWFLWNKRTNIWIQHWDDEKLVRDIVTQDNRVFDMRLRYACSFSPNDVKAPTFRLLIPEWHDQESIESIVREIIDPEVDEDARTFFKSIAFNQVHKGAYRVFKEQFPARITAQMFPYLGISIEAWSVKCQPIIDKEYRHSSQQAEAQRLELELERERRLVELAPIERLIQMYMIDGVPLQLLAWFAHQERGRGYRAPDLEQLRDVDIKQRARYVYRYVTEALGEDVDFEDLKDKIKREMYEPPSDSEISLPKSPPPKILQARSTGDLINQRRDA